MHKIANSFCGTEDTNEHPLYGSSTAEFRDAKTEKYWGVRGKLVERHIK